jgi:hypothetical protein
VALARAARGGPQGSVSRFREQHDLFGTFCFLQKIKVFWFFFSKKNCFLPAFYARRIAAENRDKLAQRNKRLHFGSVLCWRQKGWVRNEKARKQFFFEKKNQKTFAPLRGGAFELKGTDWRRLLAADQATSMSLRQRAQPRPLL